SAPDQAPSVFVSQGTLDALSIPPALGRWFTEKDDSPEGPETVILTHGYWQRHFGSEASAIGRRIVADGVAREIIGVMPPHFRFLEEKPELIFPMRFNRGKTTLGNFSFHAIARLKPGMTVAHANADLGRMIPMVNTKFPPAPGFSARMFEQAGIQPAVRPLKQDLIGELSKVLWVLM